jgi:uncharacterized membrane protein YvlD (DUF360 family)
MHTYMYLCMYQTKKQIETVPMEESSSLQLSELAPIHKTSPLLIYSCMRLLSLSLSKTKIYSLFFEILTAAVKCTPKSYSLPTTINCSGLFLRLVIASLFLIISFSRNLAAVVASLSLSLGSPFIRRWGRWR